MPWPVTHILIAEKTFDQFFNPLDRKAFILGTCFPDIRYPARIERNRTHIDERSLSKIQSQSAFRAGMFFHSFVDGLWNKHIQEHSESLFVEIPHNLAMIHTMKVLQDGYLYARLEDWERIASYFGTIHPDETGYGVSETMIQRWHKILALYLSKPPNIADLNMLKLSLPEDLIGKMTAYFQAYRENKTLSLVMVDFYDRFESLIENPASDL